MEPISFGLGLIAEAQTVVSSIKDRIANYRDGPTAFCTLTDNLDGLARNIAQVEMILEKFRTVVPNDISDIFDSTFSRVHGILEDSNAAMERSFSKAFSTRISNAKNKFRSKAARTYRANTLRRKMDAVDANIKDASDQLLLLSLSLGNAFKMQQHHEALVAGQTPEDTFRVRANAPALNDAINLDFDDQDGERRPATPEGILKQSILLSDASSTVTATSGVIKRAYGIVGMAGVGKTIALQGLAHDKDIRNRFPDGVLYMTLGQGATVQSVLRELVKVFVITGANRIAIVVSQCTVLRDAVDHATHLFQKRSCLFLVDDIWPTIDCKTGYLSDLRQVLRESPASRMAISTRCTAIAQCAGAFVHFGVREPLEKSSMKIFLSYATSGLSGGRQAELVSKLRSNVLKILSICGGLPIALAVTGTAVAFLARAHGDFESACQSYVTRLEKKRCLLGDEDTLEGKSLNASILLSLEFLEAELLKWKARRLQFMKYSIKDLYTSLCVIKNQAWVSASVLGRLWRLSEDDAMDVMQLFCGMSLGTLQVREASSGSFRKPGIVLHDLQLEFCQMQAKYMNTSSL